MNYEDRPATKTEACREYAMNVGADHPEQAWLLTDYDTWERNPHYHGPAVPHPEDYHGEDEDRTENEWSGIVVADELQPAIPMDETEIPF